MSSLKSQNIYSADALLATANGASKTVDVQDGQNIGYVQIYIEADALTTSAVKLEIQGRLSASGSWVTLDKADNSTEASVTATAGVLVEAIFPVQLMPLMRVKHSGTYAATAGNDVDVWLLAKAQATRADN